MDAKELLERIMDDVLAYYGGKALSPKQAMWANSLYANLMRLKDAVGARQEAADEEIAQLEAAIKWMRGEDDVEKDDEFYLGIWEEHINGLSFDDNDQYSEDGA